MSTMGTPPLTAAVIRPAEESPSPPPPPADTRIGGRIVAGDAGGDGPGAWVTSTPGTSVARTTAAGSAMATAIVALWSASGATEEANITTGEAFPTGEALRLNVL